MTSLNLTTEEAAQYLRLSEQTLNNWRSQRKGPPYHKIEGSIRYLIKDLQEWVETHKVTPEKE